MSDFPAAPARSARCARLVAPFSRGKFWTGVSIWATLSLLMAATAGPSIEITGPLSALQLLAFGIGMVFYGMVLPIFGGLAGLLLYAFDRTRAIGLGLLTAIAGTIVLLALLSVAWALLGQ